MTFSFTATIGKQQELYFDHDQPQNKFDLTPREALNLLRDMCKVTADDIKRDTPSQFSSLVYLMKRMDLASLRRVYNQANRPNFCTKNGERIKLVEFIRLNGNVFFPSLDILK